MTLLTIDSCHSTWVFDTERMRFRRALKGIVVDAQPVWTQWRPYFGLEMSEGSEWFTVVLNASGSRLIRSWRHDAECTQCRDHETGELSLDAIGMMRLTTSA